MRFPEALAALDARVPERMVPDLDRMRALSDLLGQPQLSYPSLHVTGTNGKTTTAAVCTQLLRAAGLAIGTYTSPHLVSVTERILFSGEPISEHEFADTYAYLEPFFEIVDARGERVTWFEALTMLAQVWFAERSVAAGVFEVGMGGTWDATNLIDARVAMLCEIALDHPELGSTPVEIAGEKAGIIKPDSIALTAEQEPDVLSVLERRAADVGAELRVWGNEFVLEERLVAMGGQRLRIRVRESRYEDVFLPLYGEALARDATLALAGVSAFLGDRELDDDLVAEAMTRVRSPGRLEVVSRAPLIVLDGAHNPAAAVAAAAGVGESFTFERLILVVSVLADKDVAGVLRPFVPPSSLVIATQNASPRAAPAERIAAEARALGGDVHVVASVAGALAFAREHASAGDCILVTGSLYTVGEARTTLLS